jgi:AGZA family xanthine/uracil permease-like MFS transporter
VIGVEAIATIIAGACGGVIQTTPYIGHPAYKAMGGRAAYTLMTAAFIGLAGLTGTFAYLYQILPGPALVPILVFVGLEITSQSFHATPQRHYPAVALACVPALAALAKIETDKVMAAGARPDALLSRELFSLQIISAGFIVTSVLWAGMLTALLDRRLLRAAGWCLAAAAFTVCGVIHSPFTDGRLFLPWAIGDLPAEAAGRGPLELALAYALLAALYIGWSVIQPATPLPDATDDHR